MSVHSYQCPNCGAPLQWTAGEGSEQGAVACEYCLGKFTVEEVIRYNEDLEAKIREEAADSPPGEKLQGFSKEEGDLLRSYICDNCGAEVVSDSKTSATFCYYCHSPVILTDRISGKFRPEYIIPFQVSREEAVKRFLSWAKSKKFVPKDFYSDSQLEKMTGIYLAISKELMSIGWSEMATLAWKILSKWPSKQVTTFRPRPLRPLPISAGKRKCPFPPST